MTIQLNGKPHELAGPLSVLALLESLTIDPRTVAVELNRVEAGIIRSAMQRHGIETPGVTPEELSTIIETVARGLAFASQINTDRFNRARLVITDWLDKFGITYRVLSDVSKREVNPAPSPRHLRTF